ncbi:MAG: hypothetical protein IT282_11945 [Bacteroidetes bacterium]|nr:hypothetical protein [Bacteroidota bacterium]
MNRRLHLFLDIADAFGQGNSGIQSSRHHHLLPDFLAFCREREISATVFSGAEGRVLSDALRKEGFGEVRVVSDGHLWLPSVDGSSMAEWTEFPYANSECDGCFHCKRNVMLASAGEGDVLIYIGDGHADPCPAEYADTVFAAGPLQTWCQQHNITHSVFQDLADVQKQLASACERRTLRPRPRAERKRREAYLIEA